MMAKPIFTLVDRDGFRMAKFDIPGGVTTPEQFAEAVGELGDRLAGPFVLLVNGRGPVWGYGMIFHGAHPSMAIAVYDPRLGYVVVQTHDERFWVGQVLEYGEEG